jgi:hypothetical protein
MKDACEQFSKGAVTLGAFFFSLFAVPPALIAKDPKDPAENICRLGALVRHDQSEQKSKLAALAATKLAPSPDALTALAKELALPTTEVENANLASQVIDKLLTEPSIAPLLTKLIRQMIKFDRARNTAAAKAVEQIAFILVPAALSASRIEEFHMALKSAGPIQAFSAKTRDMVELAMAQADGRPVHFYPVSTTTERRHSKFALETAPDEGIDDSGDRFIDDVIAELDLLPSGHVPNEKREQRIRRVEEDLSERRKEGLQKYYVFALSENEEALRVQLAQAEKLKAKLPSLAVITLDRSGSHVDELEFVTRFARIMAHASGFEVNPHR